MMMWRHCSSMYGTSRHGRGARAVVSVRSSVKLVPSGATGGISMLLPIQLHVMFSARHQFHMYRRRDPLPSAWVRLETKTQLPQTPWGNSISPRHARRNRWAIAHLRPTCALPACFFKVASTVAPPGVVLSCETKLVNHISPRSPKITAATYNCPPSSLKLDGSDTPGRPCGSHNAPATDVQPSGS
ncbi:hypothetical protein RRG08_026041 [Elysia crispata]|uniref:Uncharacterized protein n=1 Tax=Elysia crispata TaxID=231223 RepID=A0AAE0Z0L0_9GAST|nr:hypothetical protein RRG08_026041 [Elysia crispata]